MDPGVSVEVTEATGDIVPVGLAVLAPGVGEHVDVVQGVGAAQPVLDHGRHLHRVLLTGVESLEGGDDTDQTRGGAWSWGRGPTAAGCSCRPPSNGGGFIFINI